MSITTHKTNTGMGQQVVYCVYSSIVGVVYLGQR